MKATEDLVDHYLLEWGSDGWAEAYHNLIRLGPEILPLLQARLEERDDPRFRAAVVQVGREQRTSAALPLFRRALAERDTHVWKAALDGLVALATPEAIACLEESVAAEHDAPSHRGPYIPWVEEALEQARESRAEEEPGA